MADTPAAPAPGGGANDDSASSSAFQVAVQVGVVVKDLGESMRQLTQVFGIGPFRVIECPPAGREDEQFYYGRPARFRTRQAFADLGSIELELIEPLEGRTIWSDFLARHGPGIHHIRFNVPDLEAVVEHLEDKGVGVTQEGAGIRSGTYWVNFDTEERVGFTIEVMKPAPGADGRTPRSADTEEKK